MSEEMKLLMALCDALGFAVETVQYREERKVTGTDASRINSHVKYPGLTGLKLKSESVGGGQPSFIVDDQGMYTACLIEPTTSYKLTKL